MSKKIPARYPEPKNYDVPATVLADLAKSAKAASKGTEVKEHNDYVASVCEAYPELSSEFVSKGSGNRAYYALAPTFYKVCLEAGKNTTAEGELPAL